MIVGLGSSNGGELLIEGEPAEIGYCHWTAPFNGEIYYMEWFTPEMKMIILH